MLSGRQPDSCLCVAIGGSGKEWRCGDGGGSGWQIADSLCWSPDYVCRGFRSEGSLNNQLGPLTQQPQISATLRRLTILNDFWTVALDAPLRSERMMSGAFFDASTDTLMRTPRTERVPLTTPVHQSSPKAATPQPSAEFRSAPLILASEQRFPENPFPSLCPSPPRWRPHPPPPNPSLILTQKPGSYSNGLRPTVAL